MKRHDPRLEAAACSGKTPYPSPQAAWRTTRRRKETVVYKCPFCGHYHVGHGEYR